MTVLSLIVRTVGLSVDIRGATRPACSVVVIDDNAGLPAVVATFQLTSSNEDLASQLRALHTSVETRLKGLLPLDRAVIRRADQPPRPSNKEGPRLRLIAEGAIIAAVRGVVPDTRVGAGLEFGRWHGTDKAGVDAAGTAAIEASGHGRTAGERKHLALAAAAALAGQALPLGDLA